MADQMLQIKGKFDGTWKYDRDDNFEAFLNAIGMNFAKKKMVKLAKPTCVIKVDGDNITIKTSAGPVEVGNTFKLGEEFESDNQGEKGKVIGTYEGDKICVNPSPNNTNPKIPIATREIVNGEMCLTLKLGDVVANRYFKKA